MLSHGLDLCVCFVFVCVLMVKRVLCELCYVMLCVFLVRVVVLLSDCVRVLLSLFFIKKYKTVLSVFQNGVVCGVMCVFVCA